MGAWKVRLAVALDDVRASILRGAPAELPAFESAAGHLRDSLAWFGSLLPNAGWAGFATRQSLWHVEALPFPPPEVVRWRQGVHLAPYVRALKLHHRVVVAVIGRTRASVHEYRGGALHPRIELQAASPPVEAVDVGVSKRAARTSGRRGVTRSDSTARALDESARRLQRRLTSTLLALAGSDGGVVLGGSAKAVAAVRSELELKLVGRIVEMPEIAYLSSSRELEALVGEAASVLTRLRQSRLLDACVRAGDGASRGWNETYRALAAAAVDTLLLSRGLIESSPDDADRLVRLALAQGADVEEIGDELGSHLASELGGVAARLRYRLPT